MPTTNPRSHQILRRVGAGRAGLAPAALLVLLWAPALVPPGHAQSGAQGHDGSVQFSPISGPLHQLRRHTRLRNPDQLTADAAQQVYSIFRRSLGRGYALAGVPAASAYQDWAKVNTAPYRSVTHGNHYLNNYVNPVGDSAYREFEAGAAMPVGSIIAKDSFAATESGEILLGPLFLMEKMPPGFMPLTNDWRFSQVQPDGSLLGQTGGDGGQRVHYCIGCHLSAPRDLLYFMPEKFRPPP